MVRFLLGIIQYMFAYSAESTVIRRTLAIVYGIGKPFIVCELFFQVCFTCLIIKQVISILILM